MARFPRIKKRSILVVLGIVIILLIAAGIIFHLLPGPGTLTRYFEPRAGLEAVHPLADAKNAIGAPMNRPLIADFLEARASDYSPLSIRFLDMSRGSPATWDWDFGDGTHAASKDQVHEYRQPGLYNATLQITRPDGSVRSVTEYDVLGIARPEPHQVLVDTLRQGTLKKGAYVTFVSGYGDSYCTIDGNHLPLPNGSLVKLRSNADGDGMISIRQGNLLKFSVPDATLYINGTQVARGSSGDCNLPDFRYFSTNFTYTVVPTKGDIRQIVLNGQKIRAGVENSRILITHDSGDHNADLTMVTVPAFFEGSAARFDITTAVIADFAASPHEGDAPLNVSFTDLSAGGPATWSWDFGDGTRSAEQNPVHQYVTPGSYTVTLIVARGDLSDVDVQKNLVVATPPRLEADFSALPVEGVVPLVVRFSDNSTGSPWMWNWNFWKTDDSVNRSSSSQQNPVITFTEPGNYNVWLSVNNIYGSSDLMRPQYIIITDPYRFPDTKLKVRTGKQGYIEKDSCIQFIVSDTPATISINGGYRNLPKGSLVRIEAMSNQKGDIYMDKGQLLKFGMPDAGLYIDGDLIAVGRIDSIYVPYMTDFRTALNYYLEPASSWTTVNENGYQVLGDWDNAWIRFSNIGMNDGSLRLSVSDNSTLIDGAVNQTVHDWVIA